MERGWAVVPCPSPKHQHEEFPCRYLGVQQGRAPASKPRLQHSSSPFISSFFFFFHMPLSDGAGPALVFHRWGASISEAHLTASKLYRNVRISPGLEPVPKHSFPALLMPCSARAGSCWFLLLGATCRCRASGSHT